MQQRAIKLRGLYKKNIAPLWPSTLRRLYSNSLQNRCACGSANSS